MKAFNYLRCGVSYNYNYDQEKIYYVSKCEWYEIDNTQTKDTKGHFIVFL